MTAYDRFTVNHNRCRCHPETCACLPWAVFEDMVRMSTFYDKPTAERVANALNRADGVGVDRYQTFCPAPTDGSSPSPTGKTDEGGQQ